MYWLCAGRTVGFGGERCRGTGSAVEILFWELQEAAAGPEEGGQWCGSLPAVIRIVEVLEINQGHTYGG